MTQPQVHAKTTTNSIITAPLPDTNRFLGMFPILSLLTLKTSSQGEDKTRLLNTLGVQNDSIRINHNWGTVNILTALVPT